MSKEARTDAYYRNEFDALNTEAEALSKDWDAITREEKRAAYRKIVSIVKRLHEEIESDNPSAGSIAFTHFSPFVSDVFCHLVDLDASLDEIRSSIFDIRDYYTYWITRK